LMTPLLQPRNHRTAPAAGIGTVPTEPSAIVAGPCVRGLAQGPICVAAKATLMIATLPFGNAMRSVTANAIKSSGRALRWSRRQAE
jgi:hypothetical protein